MTNAFRKLPARRARWFAIHAQMRDVLWQALVDRMRGQSRIHVAEGVLSALDPESPRRADWQVDMMRAQASGLELSEDAARRAALARYQLHRTKRNLRDGD